MNVANAGVKGWIGPVYCSTSNWISDVLNDRMDVESHYKSVSNDSVFMWKWQRS